MQVEHDARRHRFFIAAGTGTAVLTYTPPAPGVMDLRHTLVPPEAAGHGLGNALARAAFDYARGSGERLVVTCPFVRGWLKRHPEERDVVDSAPTAGSGGS